MIRIVCSRIIRAAARATESCGLSSSRRSVSAASAVAAASSPTDRSTIRALALEHRGAELELPHAQWPDRRFTMGVRRDRLAEFLDTVGKGGALRVQFDGLGFVYGEHRIDTGPVQLYAPHMRLINRDELEAATVGNANLQADWECADGTGIHISRIADPIEAA